MKNWGIPALISFVIVIGLILRFGKSSHFILTDIFSGTVNGIKALTLSGMPGNNP